MGDANFSVGSAVPYASSASPMPHSESSQNLAGTGNFVPTLSDVSVSGTKTTATSRSPQAVDMKPTDTSESPEGKRQEVLLPVLQMEDARDAKVPVVVLGATIGGLATALAIRSRTGRAVCVIDVDGKDSEEQTSSISCLLSARSLDAMRAINTDLHRAVLHRISKENVATPPLDAATEWASTGPLRVSFSSLRNVLIDYLTAGAGGRSWLWRSKAVKQICVDSPTDATKTLKKTNIHFADNVVLKTDLVVVANADFPVAGCWREQAEDLLCVEGAAPLPHKVSDGVWTFRNSKGLHVSLLTDAEKQSVFFVASSPVAALNLCAENLHPGAAAVACRIVEVLQTEDPTAASDTTLLSTVFDAIKATPNCVSSSRCVNSSESSWSFWGGRLVLTGAAAHPWDAPLADSLELALEDAAQLGCSLFDWKFTLRLASDRFQSIRKRRLASLLSVPKVAKSSFSDSCDAPCGTSTAAVSPDSKNEDQMFVPTRDAYAELLPAAGVGYEVEEAEFS